MLYYGLLGGDPGNRQVHRALNFPGRLVLRHGIVHILVPGTEEISLRMSFQHTVCMNPESTTGTLS